MQFVFKKTLHHGSSNPIVARLGYQTYEILRLCNLSKDTCDYVSRMYLDTLSRKLLRCWEINERFRSEFQQIVAEYKRPPPSAKGVELPQITRLEEECHNFLYEAKNYIRELLNVVNALYGTSFSEASEFSRGRDGKQSLVDFAAANFGPNDPKSTLFRDSVGFVEYLIACRNAVEHPGGYSGTLRVENFTLLTDHRLGEPVWWRERDGKMLSDVASIRSDLDVAISNLLGLAEEIVALWAVEHFSHPHAMQINEIPEDRRDPKNPVRLVVGLNADLAAQLKSKRADPAEQT